MAKPSVKDLVDIALNEIIGIEEIKANVTTAQERHGFFLGLSEAAKEEAQRAEREAKKHAKKRATH